MIRLFKVENPREFTDFANDLFTGGSRIQQFDYPNDALQINNVWYHISSAVILQNADVAKPLALNVINQWVDLTNLQNIGQLHDLGIGVMAKTDTTSNVAGNRDEFRYIKGYAEIEIDTSVANVDIQLLPQLQNMAFYIDSLSWIKTAQPSVGEDGALLFSNIDGDGEEGFSIAVHYLLQVFTLLIPTGYTSKKAIDLSSSPWTVKVITPSVAGHKIKIFFDGKLFKYTPNS